MTATLDDPALTPSRTPARWLGVTSVGTGLSLAAVSMLGDTPGTLRALSLVGNLASPWLLGALLVGWRAGRTGTSARKGAVLGTATLLVASAGYYLSWAALGYAPNANTVLWVAVAVAVGPVAGWCGATMGSRADGWRHVVATAAPAAMVLAEIGWVAIDRGAWRWDLVDEPHRAIDLGVLVVLACAGAALAWIGGRGRRGHVIALVTIGSLAGVLAFDALMRTAATI